MRLVERMRGVLGSALTWSVIWSALGGLATVSAEVVAPSVALSQQGIMGLWDLALAGGKLFGLVGAFSGATFAMMLALTGRRLTFERLSGRRMAALGAIGSTLVSGALLGVMGVATSSWTIRYSSFLSMAALLGAGSAWLMLRLARKKPDASPPAALSSGSSQPRWSAREKESVRRDNLTMLGADGRLR